MQAGDSQQQAEPEHAFFLPPCERDHVPAFCAMLYRGRSFFLSFFTVISPFLWFLSIAYSKNRPRRIPGTNCQFLGTNCAPSSGSRISVVNAPASLARRM